MSNFTDYLPPSPGGPATGAFAITPSDSTDLTIVPLCLHISGGGIVKLRTMRGETVSLTVGNGQLLPVRATRILATGTTATGIVGLY